MTTDGVIGIFLWIVWVCLVWKVFFGKDRWNHV